MHRLLVAGPFFLVASFAACNKGPPPVPPAHARSWTPLEAESRRVHAVVAAAIIEAPLCVDHAAAEPRTCRRPAPPPPRRAVPRRVQSGVRVFTGDAADCPSEALGVVNERAFGDEAAALERLKEKAHAMGADAIVGYRTTSSGVTGTDLAGVAIHCAKLTEDRPIETIEHLEVPVTPGAEQEAFDELLARANSLDASLVTEVHLERDKDGTGSKVVGKAIKYH
jgi:uncharacterized protein YbjQ (UPF0145 family)